MTESTDSQTATPDQRKAALARAVQHEVASGGRVESQTDYNAIIRYGKKTNHVLHLILTIVTFTAWALVWIGVAIYNITQRETISLEVDDYGNILRQKLA